MRVAVFGASGRTGRRVVEQALGRGHAVTAFVRDASRLDASGGTVVEGDAKVPDAVGRAIAGNDAVISVLALMSVDAEPEHSEATRAVVEAAERERIHRVVVTANNDVFGDEEVTGAFAAHAREHRRNRDLLRTSGLDWTMGAAPFVVDEPGNGYGAVVGAKGPGKKISTQDYAAFALDALGREEWIGHIIGVTSTS